MSHDEQVAPPDADWRHALSRRVIRLSPFVRYGIAVGTAIAAVLVRLALDPLWGSALPYITLFPAIMLSAWLGGLWPGIVTTALTAASAQYFWIEPGRSWLIDNPSEWIGLGVFVVVGILISALNESWRAMVAAAEQRAVERARLIESRDRAEELARAEIERASRLKDEFLAVLSHELRTPLNAVVGYAHLLSSGALSPDRAAHAIAAIQRNAQAQVRMVESLLDLSRIMAGKLELDLERLDVAKIAEAAVDIVRPDADAKEIALSVLVPPGIPEVVGDAGRLQQVFGNLLSNAIKFTPRGGRVDIHVAQRDGAVSIAVSDTGQGIPSDLLPHVFDRFKQGETHGRGPSAGLGLGLSLVREMVQAHGGSVTADSPGEGRGSTFVVTLPLATGAVGEQPPIALSSAVSAARRTS